MPAAQQHLTAEEVADASFADHRVADFMAQILTKRGVTFRPIEQYQIVLAVRQAEREIAAIDAALVGRRS